MILLADIGATNARFSVTTDGFKYEHSDNIQVIGANSLEELFSSYLTRHRLRKKVNKAVIGVAAPIINDKVSFVNANISFSIKELKKRYFMEGLTVINDLALQAHAIKNLEKSELSFIGLSKQQARGPKLLVSPGTGLGLAGITDQEIISTEAGHLNIPQKEIKHDLSKIIDTFISTNKRVPTYEDFLSGKGIRYFYEVLSGGKGESLSGEEILDNKDLDENCTKTKDLLIYLLASYLRYVALVWGSTGGVYLSGSIVNSLITKETYQTFREVFEDSETMQDLLKAIPLILVTINDIGFRGALELSKKL
jgi:glucokinase